MKHIASITDGVLTCTGCDLNYDLGRFGAAYVERESAFQIQAHERYENGRDERLAKDDTQWYQVASDGYSGD